MPVTRPGHFTRVRAHQGSPCQRGRRAFREGLTGDGSTLPRPEKLDRPRVDQFRVPSRLGPGPLGLASWDLPATPRLTTRGPSVGKLRMVVVTNQGAVLRPITQDHAAIEIVMINLTLQAI